jgi:repressor LexA
MTPRAHQTLKFVSDYIARNGYSPSIREIGQGIGNSSVNSVHRLVSGLISDGYLTRKAGRARSLEVASVNDNCASADARGARVDLSAVATAVLLAELLRRHG